jgi:uncharacterized protein YyaL (SSP411 family)
MPNRLAQESSLYLRQHADNPVDWWPWGEAALQAAREQDKPLLVSIGYSSCHWCHVMAHESFEDDYIAGLMNRHFICIKVDREERPDLDQIYMEAVQMLNQHGGWPLNVFCLPDGRPFFGGTYFPPEERGHNIIPWPQLLMRVADYYRKERTALEENADNIIKNLAHTNTPEGADQGELNPGALLAATEGIARMHDDNHGGFGGAPKFPPSMTINFLLTLRQSAAVESRPALAKRLDTLSRITLDAMARGGLYDQLGGGFARYSVDERWAIPHFEKMLYDNALLLGAYTRGWRQHQRPLYAAVVTETVDWLTREMRGPEGLFYASVDADSEGEEGRFYLWTPAAIEAVLGPDEAKRFCQAYGVTETGNFEGGRTHLNLAAAITDAERAALAPARERLRLARESRTKPGTDTKRLTAWNALLIGNLAEAAFTFNRPDWLTLARQAAEALETHLRQPDGRWHAVFDGETPRGDAFLDDYAFAAQAWLRLAAVLDWAEPGQSTTAIARAQELLAYVIDHFSDEHALGYYFTSDQHERLVSRKKEWWDNAIPSGQSALAHCFADLAALTGEAQWSGRLDELRRAYPGLIKRVPTAIAHALEAFATDALGVAVLKVKGPVDPETLREALVARPYRRLFWLSTDDAAQPEGLQLCVGTQCLEPVRDAETMADYLGSRH